MTDSPICYKTVDSDIFHFLRFAAFGIVTDELETASQNAYRDLCRTLDLKANGVTNECRWELRLAVLDVFRKEIPCLISGRIQSQEAFDLWHRSVSDQLKAIYAQAGVPLTYGQAQKWINMTIKYLYLLEYARFEDIFFFLHLPIDNYIFRVAQSELGIPIPKKAWSNWDAYEEEYLVYQTAIRQAIGELSPMRWEFQHWLKAIEESRLEK